MKFPRGVVKGKIFCNFPRGENFFFKFPRGEEEGIAVEENFRVGGQ